MRCRPVLAPLALTLLGALALGGCTGMLPRGSTETPQGFASFEAAEAAIRRVEGRKTRTDELKDLGFDLVAGTNVTLIPYPDIVARLAPYPGVPIDQLDAGVRQCIEAQQACRGYVFHFEWQSRRRDGGFWLDFLNVRRHTSIKGWWFDALIVVSDGTVLFRNYGGQASTDREEKQVNPLGPLQPAGESAGYKLIH
ncbi:hypothetical protein [Ramlibacter sp.]|uniref:hypothetical protein n=1 Tax=Ramlibacter sp. TaxID=1917967 RepID=UPI002C8072F5|nr:hypothetical protein [Ramlibacter sp.]HWI81183.1 hypothetical protein [Ramlibacter sp.]